MSLTKEQCEEFWGIADKNGDGELTIQELAAAARQYRPDLTDKECASMFCGIDRSGDKKISKQEFMEEMAEKPKRSESLKQLFKESDTSGDGSLSQDELRVLIAKCFKPELVDDVMEQFLQYCDASGDGKISFDEFVAFFN